WRKQLEHAWSLWWNKSRALNPAETGNLLAACWTVRDSVENGIPRHQPQPRQGQQGLQPHRDTGQAPLTGHLSLLKRVIPVSPVDFEAGPGARATTFPHVDWPTSRQGARFTAPVSTPGREHRRCFGKMPFDTAPGMLGEVAWDTNGSC